MRRLTPGGRRPARGPARGAILGVCLGLAVALAPAPNASADPALPAGFQDTVAFANLEQPTAVRFAPNGMVFVAEKAGRILVYEDLEDETPELFKDLRTEVYDHGDRGLLGLAIDPSFPSEPYIYALFTYDHILGESEPPPKWGTPEHTGDSCPVAPANQADDCLVSARLVRYTAEVTGGGEEPLHAVAGAETALIPEEWCQQFSSHSIGDLHFGPEGALYASGGDGASFTNADYGQFGEPQPNPCDDPPGGVGVALEPPSAEGGSLRAQNLAKLDGKIIRIDPETGQGLSDNPMFGSLDENTRRIVAEGFRNPFRFTLDPQSGELYTDNVGSSEIEEVDRFPAPPTTIFNSGWPCYEGPERQFQFRVLGLAVCNALYEGEPESTSEPLFYYSHGQSAVPNDECPIEYGSALGGISFYKGEEFPSQYKGALFISDAVRGCVWVMFAGDDGRPDPTTTTRFMRESRIYPAVDIQEGPEGDLYYVDLFGDEEFGEGAIHRITYAPGAPTARLKAGPQWGSVDPNPLQVTLDAGESSDPEEETLEYEWDLDGDGTFETPTGEDPLEELEFTKVELEEEEEHDESLNRVVAVRVTDEQEHSSVDRVTLYPGDSPPVPTIENPSQSVEWGVGDDIEFHGSALDFGGSPISTPLSYYWSTRILHCPTGPSACHAHPLQVFAGVTHGEIVAPEHDYPSYIEITLRVADKRGLTASTTVKLEPRAVHLAIGSSPPGIELTAGLVQGPGPVSVTAIEGSQVLLVAPATAQIGGETYTWRSWSDGGARVHTIRADKSDSYDAVYSTPEPPPQGESPPETRPGPQTRLRKHPPKTTRSRIGRFAFVASEPGSRFRCRLDRGRFRPCRSPHLYKHLKPGGHVFRVFAIDPAGNRDRSPAVFRWRIRRTHSGGRHKTRHRVRRHHRQRGR